MPAPTLASDKNADRQRAFSSGRGSISGLDSTTLYVSSNYFNLSPPGNFTASVLLWAFDANALPAGNAIPGRSSLSADLGLPNDAFAPAHMYGSKSGFSGDFLVNYVQNNSGDDTLNITQVSSAAQGTPITNSQSLNVGNISDALPSGARQSGSSTLINDGDDRILNAVWSNDKLYAVNEIRIDTGTDRCGAGRPAAAGQSRRNLFPRCRPGRVARPQSQRVGIGQRYQSSSCVTRTMARPRTVRKRAQRASSFAILKANEPRAGP